MHTAKHTMCGNDATSMNSANMKLNTLSSVRQKESNMEVWYRELENNRHKIIELIKLVVNVFWHHFAR